MKYYLWKVENKTKQNKTKQNKRVITKVGGGTENNSDVVDNHKNVINNLIEEYGNINTIIYLDKDMKTVIKGLSNDSLKYLYSHLEPVDYNNMVYKLYYSIITQILKYIYEKPLDQDQPELSDIIRANFAICLDRIGKDNQIKILHQLLTDRTNTNLQSLLINTSI